MLKKFLLICSLLLISLLAYGQETEYETDPFFENDKGLHQYYDALYIPDGSASALSNVYFWQKCIKNRLGFVEHNETVMVVGKPVKLLNQFTEFDGDKFLIGVCGGKLWQDKALTGTFTEITNDGTALVDGNECDTVSFSIGGDMHWILFAGTDPIKWKEGGNASDLGGSPPDKCDIAHVWRQRILASGDDDTPSSLFYCVPGDAEDWAGTTAGEINIDPQDGQRITGLSSLAYAGSQIYGYLAIYKERKSYVLIHTTDQTPSEGELITVSDKIGSVNNHGIQVANGIIYFVSYEGIYAQSGTELKPISDPICDVWDGLSTTRLENCVSGQIPEYRQIWWSFSESGESTNNTTIVFRWDTGVWTVFDYGREAFCNYVDASNVTRLYGGNATGTVYREFYGTNDDGTAISWYWTSKIYCSNAIQYIKQYKRLLTLAENTGNYDIDIDVYFDYNPTGVASYAISCRDEDCIFDSATFDDGHFDCEGTIRTVTPFPTHQRCWAIQLKFSGNTLNQEVSIKGFMLEHLKIQRWEL